MAAGTAAQLLLAACLGEDTRGGEAPTPSPDVDLAFYVMPQRPLIINATTHGGPVTFHAIHLSPAVCPAAGNVAGNKVERQVSILTFDRLGRTGSFLLTADPNQREHTLTIDLPGSPPFLVVGDDRLCLSTASHVRGIAQGWQLSDEYYYTTYLEGQDVVVSVGVGEQSRSVSWNPGPFAWDLFQGYTMPDRREGETIGTMTLYDPSGNATRVDSYSLAGSGPDYDGFMMLPGEYRLELVLDAPALQTTSWAFHLDFFRFSADLCRFGFEWIGMCGPIR